MAKELQIQEFNIQNIRPRSIQELQGGSKLIIIGASGSGKSQLIKFILYTKRNLIPLPLIMSGTEQYNAFYRDFIPDTFIYNELKEEAINSLFKRQRLAKQYIKENPWSLLVIDDLTDHKATLKKQIFETLFKTSRHYSMLFILAMQHALDISPTLRSNTDYIFCFKEHSIKNRKTLFENYFSIVGDFKLFCKILDEITEDYCCLVKDNTVQTNDWRECIFWFKAPIIMSPFYFGCKEIWKFHQERFDKHYNSLFELT